MQEIAEEDIIARLRIENPWWESSQTNQVYREVWKPRAYLELFLPLMKQISMRRAIVLMGPRRVGKTVMIHHAIQALLDEGVPPKTICYFSVDSPIFNMLRIDQFLSYYSKATGIGLDEQQLYIVFDEIQYLKNWEVHLKSLVDTYPKIKCVVSGSAAAALRLKSDESGAGRFTDFLLPPLTFYEYLNLIGEQDLIEVIPSENPNSVNTGFTTKDIARLNSHFIYYINFGGYPEVIFSPHIQADPARFIKSDIIDKVLLRDLPSLYGISDIQELNYLFTTLAFNTANEVSLQELSQSSGVAKNTIKRYIEYLEAAFLIKIIHRVDRSAKRFRRANFYKIYLTNPSMRAALFSPVGEDDKALPYLAETAIFSQWFHSDSVLHYARWPEGEVDIVMLSVASQRPLWAVEVKWSDRHCHKPDDLKQMIDFCIDHQLTKPWVTSKTIATTQKIKGINLTFVPAAIYCYTVGYNIIKRKGEAPIALLPIEPVAEDINEDPVQ